MIPDFLGIRNRREYLSYGWICKMERFAARVGGGVGSFSQDLLQAIEFLIKIFWPLNKTKSLNIGIGIAIH